MKLITCPSCREKTFNEKAKRCVNYKCTLQHARFAVNIRRDKFTWTRLWWKIYYLRPRAVCVWLRNRFINRYDLVRTGLPKAEWMDVDYKMFLAVMSLVEQFVIDEEGIYFVDTGHETPCLKEHEISQNKTTQKILDLYIDWKVTYPSMCERLHEMLIDDDCDNDVYFEYEEEIHKYENQLMRRAINLRMSMWT